MVALLGSRTWMHVVLDVVFLMESALRIYYAVTLSSRNVPVAAVSSTICLISDVVLGGLSAMYREFRIILNLDLCPTCQRALDVSVLPPILLLRVSSFLWTSDSLNHVLFS